MNKYQLKMTYGTNEWIDEQTILGEYGTIQNFQDFLLSQANELLPSKIEQAFQEQGVSVNFVKLISASISWQRGGFSDGEYHYKRKVYYEILCEIESESDFFQSPIAPLVILAIGLAIALVIAAFTVPPAFFAWLESMTTRRWKAEKGEWVLNPNTGEYEWKVITTESGSSGDPYGIGGIAIILIALMVLLFLFAGGLGKMGKLKK